MQHNISFLGMQMCCVHSIKATASRKSKIRVISHLMLRLVSSGRLQHSERDNCQIGRE
eukprot:c31666_g1_i1 orf=35-208(+)